MQWQTFHKHLQQLSFFTILHSLAVLYTLLLPTRRLWISFQARDINLDIKRVVAYRYWCNKLWNAIKFAMMNLPAGFVPQQPEQIVAEQLQTWPAAAQWILSRLNNAVEIVNKVGLWRSLLPPRVSLEYLLAPYALNRNH